MIQAPTRQEAQNIPLDKIEESLDKLWADSNAKLNSNTGFAPSRNRVMTLVVYSGNPVETENATQVINNLTGQHPSRSIIVTLLPNEGGEPVSASAVLNDYSGHTGLAHVRSEQILLTLRGAATQYVSSILLPLLLPELPTFAWWIGPLPKNDIAKSLSDISDRAILDSSVFADPEFDLVRLAEMVREQHVQHSNRTAFSDFNWFRIASWRELTAQFFDSAKYQNYLQGIERVEIEYAIDNIHPHNSIQAYLYAGWLASRLHWQQYTRTRSTRGSTKIGLKNIAGDPVAIEIVQHKMEEVADWWAASSAEWSLQDNSNMQNTSSGKLISGSLIRVAISSRFEGKLSVFAIERKDYGRSAFASVNTDGAVVSDRYVSLDSTGESALLHKQLGIFARNMLFDESLLSAQSLISIDGAHLGR